MITKTTNLDSQYMELFKEIEDKSQGKIKVENLEQFFGCI
jgi:phage terminase large subunit-like protein